MNWKLSAMKTSVCLGAVLLGLVPLAPWLGAVAVVLLLPIYFRSRR